MSDFKKDERFKIAGQHLKTKKWRLFSDIYEVVPKTLLTKALIKESGKRIDKKIEDPYFFTVGELLDIAQLMNVSEKTLLEVFKNEIEERSDNRVFVKRPPVKSVDMKKVKQAQKMKREGKKIAEITKHFNCSKVTIYNWLKIY